MANFESEIISYLETLHQINSVEDQALCYKTITVPFFLPCHFEIGGNYSSFRQIQMSTENDTLGSTRNIPRVNLISFSPPGFCLPSVYLPPRVRACGAYINVYACVPPSHRDARVYTFHVRVRCMTIAVLPGLWRVLRGCQYALTYSSVNC